MQGGEELGEDARQHAEEAWLRARDDAAADAAVLHVKGVHKSVVNRLLEPFMWHTVIVTATDWDGFWRQRCSPLAQPEIRAAAEAMREAYLASEPAELAHGDWHTPLIQPDEDAAFWEEAASKFAFPPELELRVISPLEIRKAVSCARCARVSYLTHAGTRDVVDDLRLYSRLITADPPHASPLEHVATPCPEHLRGIRYPCAACRGNLDGWHQHRHEIGLG